MRHLFDWKKTEPLSKPEYWIINIILWLYSILWFSVLIFIWYGWDVSFWYKFVVTIILVIVAPTLSDLIKSYEKYKKEWETMYKKNA